MASDDELKEIARRQGEFLARAADYEARRWLEFMLGPRVTTPDMLLNSQYRIVDKGEMTNGRE